MLVYTLFEQKLACHYNKPSDDLAISANRANLRNACASMLRFMLLEHTTANRSGMAARRVATERKPATLLRPSSPSRPPRTLGNKERTVSRGQGTVSRGQGGGGQPQTPGKGRRSRSAVKESGGHWCFVATAVCDSASLKRDREIVGK